MSLRVWLKGRTRGSSGFGHSSTAEEVTSGLDLTGKTVLITGCTSGLGRESARVLAMRGARIVGLARTEAKAARACRSLRDAVPLACELTDPRSIRRCATRIDQLGLTLDVVMCNAGVMSLQERELVHGYEKQFFTNHLGHFMLIQGLTERLSASGRVVVVSSVGHRWAPPEGIRFDDLAFAEAYTPKTAYGHSKLANLLFARALAKRLPSASQTANALHPGGIATNLGRHLRLRHRIALQALRLVAFKNVAQGAATQCYLAAHPRVAQTNGAYFADCDIAQPGPHGADDAMAERLWEVSESIAAAL